MGKKKKRLKTHRDCRRYLANLINRTEGGEIEPQTASRLANITHILINCIRGSDIEEKIEELKSMIREHGGSTHGK